MEIGLKSHPILVFKHMCTFKDGRSIFSLIQQEARHNSRFATQVSVLDHSNIGISVLVYYLQAHNRFPHLCKVC